MKPLEISRLDDKAGVLQILEGFEKEGGAEAPGWLASLRKEAAACYTGLNFPTLKDEEWKYTPVGGIVKNSFSLTREPSPHGLTGKKLGTLLEGGGLWNRLVFVNGLYSKEFSSVKDTALIRIESLR